MAREDFIFDKREALSPERLDTLTSAVNHYSNSLKGHPFKNLGSIVQFKEIRLTPFYRIERKTILDKRYVTKEKRPYRGELYVHDFGKPFSENDMWSQKFIGEDNYVDKHDIQSLEKILGAYVEKCDECGGKGEYCCGVCNGTGSLKCKKCNGTGAFEHTCSHCKGKGRIWYDTTKLVRIKNSDGTSTNHSINTQDWKFCPTCRGTGTEVETCSLCGGYGKHVCMFCSGKGICQCRTCKGAGALFYYKALHSDRHALISVEYEWGNIPDDLGLEEVAKNGRVVTNSKYAHPNIAYVQGGEKINNMVSIQTKSILAQCDDLTKPQNDSLIITRYDAYSVRYSFGNKTYSGVIYNNVFYPISSPIIDYSKGLIDETNRALFNADFRKAKKIAKEAKALGLKQHNDQVNEHLRVIERYFGSFFSLGASICLWLFLFFVVPTVFLFYSYINPVLPFAVSLNDPDSWLYPYVPIVQSILYAVILLLIRQSIAQDKGDNSAEGKYFFKGFFMMLGTGFIALLILLVANFIGASIITTFFGTLALLAVGLVLGIVFMAIYLVIGLIQLLFLLIGKLF